MSGEKSSRRRGGALVWVPAGMMALGAIFTVGLDRQHSVPLRAPLQTAVPASLLGHEAQDVKISKAEARAAGFSTYLMRLYLPKGAEEAAFSVYVGYYERQMRGKTIHSPKNCLPGAGWEALHSKTETIQTAAGEVTVNRYLLQNKKQRALVLYWYQGRGRVAANEYAVKWHLLRDSAVRGRSEEALVRVLVPVTGANDEEAFKLASGVARAIVPAVNKALPTI